MRLLPKKRLVDLRGVLVRAGRRPVELLESLRAAVVHERGAELVEEDLQVLTNVRLKGGQDLVELDGDRRLVEREHVVVGYLRRARGARLYVHEQVALEEEARAKLERRVVLDRAPLLL